MTATRRLAAIFVADVVGYSRMMEADEVGTLAGLKERRTTILEPVIKEHGGRVVKYLGDGVLVEFASAVNAVKSALVLQEKFDAANGPVPDDRRIVLRIGINLGDVVGEGSDIFGDGVNIAARLEGIAEPGGICVSAKVRAEVQGKLVANFFSIGLQQLKNISVQVEAFRVSSGMAQIAALDTTLGATDPLSIAVLPFTHLGTDASVQHLAEGLTEDIITELSRVPSLHIATRNTAFRFRRPDADIATTSRNLGVRFVIEGSVRRMGPRFRITAQLIDATTGVHLWAERYDRSADSIFDTQDEVVRTIATTAASRLRIAGADIADKKSESQRTVQDLLLQAENASWSSLEDRRTVELLARRALDLDPKAARAHCLLSYILILNWSDDFDLPDSMLDTALNHARSAMELEPGNYNSHETMAYVCLYRRAFDLAEVHLARASSLSPDQPWVLITGSLLAVYSGRPAEAQSMTEAVRRLDATFASSWYWSNMVLFRYAARDYAGVIDAFHRLSGQRAFTHAYAAAAYANLGEVAAAQAQVEATLALSPRFTITKSMARDPFRHDVDRDHYRDGMQRAGLPM